MMARKRGFVANRAGIGRILKTDPGLIGAVNGAADAMAAQDGRLTVDTYVTDRFVAAIVVDGAAQAKDGAATKAAGAAGRRLR